jgi:hypothetical protein
MKEIKYEGQIYSFYELITKYSIEVPIIQRDYAQGRKEKKDIRILFLKALHNSIIYNKELMLDFIYGSIVEKTFQPLDGQQRLTTLFLLHWYAALKESTLDNQKGKLIKFTYETRISSRRFCHSLVSHTIDLKPEIPPSSQIVDSTWFYLSWKKDPTIDAMLRTIDDIHLLFYHVDDLWQKLTDGTLSFIKFYFVSLENIGLSDDLYIKMNARGKLLTSFENFKATFEKIIIDNKWEEELDYTEKFEHKIDTVWTDFFWKNFKQNNSVDASLLNLFSTLLMIRQSVFREKGTEERIKIISELQLDSNNISSSWYIKDDFEYLVEILSLLTDKLETINSFEISFPYFRHSVEEGFIKKIIRDNKGSSYTQKVILFAQLEYFKRTSNYDHSSYLDWMRVVRNVVSRGDIEKSGKRPDIIRSPQTFDGIIFLINELSGGCSDIYQYLYKTDFVISSTFAKEQIEEERVKALIFAEKPYLRPILFDLEDTDLLRGRISFVLHCIDYDGNPENIDEELLNQVKEIVLKYFHSDSVLNNDLRRALLATSINGYYLFYNYWWSYWNVADCDKRRIIDNFREIEYIIHSEFKDYIKELILNLRENTLQEIAQNFIPPSDFLNWKLRLIKEPNLLDENPSNYLAIPAGTNYCYLLKSKRPRDLNGCIKIE